MKVLGIESSCEDTGLAIYDSFSHRIYQDVYSQIEMHNYYGGVVPELASRDHIKRLLPLLRSVLTQAGIKLTQIEGIAYTGGPGLSGALLVGAAFARSLAWSLNIPAVSIHHMEGHLLASLLEPVPPSFPFLALLVSGGHTQLVHVKKMGAYKIIGDTCDDAVGEAFDKVAKLLGLGYPGGAALSGLAEKGDARRFHFTRPMVNRAGLDFSFSGLKTQVLTTVQKIDLDDQTKADVAASFQAAVIDTLVIKVQRALAYTQLNHLVVGGGVSANAVLQARLKILLNAQNGQVYFPRAAFSTDNGAMIAFAGYHRLKAGQHEDLKIHARARWEMESLLPLICTHD
jgi:N6-L-threonylcarbamoyladenine synthase